MKKTQTELFEEATSRLFERARSLRKEANQVGRKDIEELAVEFGSIAEEISKTFFVPSARQELINGLSAGTVSAVTKKGLTSSLEDGDSVSEALKTMKQSAGGRIIVYNSKSDDEELLSVLSVGDILEYVKDSEDEQLPSSCTSKLRHLKTNPFAEISMTCSLLELFKAFQTKGPNTLIVATDQRTGLAWGILDQTCIPAALASIGGTILVKKALINSNVSLETMFGTTNFDGLMTNQKERVMAMNGITIIKRKDGKGQSCVIASKKANVGMCICAMRNEMIPVIGVESDTQKGTIDAQLDYSQLCNHDFSIATISDVLQNMAESELLKATTIISHVPIDVGSIAIVSEQFVQAKPSCIWITESKSSKRIIGSIFGFDLLNFLELKL